MNGYHKIRIMNHKSLTWFDCWQEVRDNQVVGYVMDDCVTYPPIEEEHDAYILEKKLVDFPNSEAGDEMRKKAKEELLARETANDTAAREAKEREVAINAAAFDLAVRTLAARMVEEKLAEQK